MGAVSLISLIVELLVTHYIPLCSFLFHMTWSVSILFLIEIKLVSSVGLGISYIY